LYIVIENRDEIKILQNIKKVCPNIIIKNNLCEFEPTVKDLMDAICDYCKHNYYDHTNDWGRCKNKDEIL